MTSAAENAENAADGSFSITAVKLLFGVLALLLVVYIIAELTPRLAKFIDEKLRKKPSEYEEINPETYEVRSFFGSDKGKDKKSGNNKSADKKTGDEKTENNDNKKEE